MLLTENLVVCISLILDSFHQDVLHTFINSIIFLGVPSSIDKFGRDKAKFRFPQSLYRTNMLFPCLQQYVRQVIWELTLGNVIYDKCIMVHGQVVSSYCRCPSVSGLHKSYSSHQLTTPGTKRIDYNNCAQ